MILPVSEDESIIEETLSELSCFTQMETVFRDYYRLQNHLDLCSPAERRQREDAFYHYSEEIFHMSESIPYAVLPDSAEPFFKDGPIHILKHSRYIPAHVHKHSFFEFFYVLSGKCTHVCGDKQYPLSPGDFCFWQFDIPHYISSDSDEILAINILVQKPAFQAYFMSAISEQSILSTYFNKILYGSGDSPIMIFHTGDDRRLLAFICSIYQEYQKKPPQWQSMLTSCLSFLFVYLLREHQEHLSTSTKDTEYDPALQILQYIQQHYGTVTLEELCKRFNYTAPYLSRLIKKKTGMTFTQIVTRQKLERGAWLLSHTRLSISQIAQEAYCSDASHFCRLFLKAYGESPSSYRKKHFPDESSSSDSFNSL